jgi:uncharacterized protein (TIGR02391 family)
MNLRGFLPSDPDELLALEPPEIGMGILACIASLSPAEQRSLSQYSFGLVETVRDGGWPLDRQIEISGALMEGWMWLEREGLIIPKPGSQGGAGREPRMLSRQGQKLGAGHGLKEFRASLALPRVSLHPRIEERCRAEIVRGDYESAVFKAFKEVEVAVREAAKLSDRDIGADLMRKAFDDKRGPLTDLNTLEAERQATSHLFAGAIGLFKNPRSHRWVQINDPAQAAEMILMASHLLRIVDTQRKTEETQ